MPKRMSKLLSSAEMGCRWGAVKLYILVFMIEKGGKTNLSEIINDLKQFNLEDKRTIKKHIDDLVEMGLVQPTKNDSYSLSGDWKKEKYPKQILARVTRDPIAEVAFVQDMVTFYPLFVVDYMLSHFTPPVSEDNPKIDEGEAISQFLLMDFMTFFRNGNTGNLRRSLIMAHIYLSDNTRTRKGTDIVKFTLRFVMIQLAILEPILRKTEEGILIMNLVNEYVENDKTYQKLKTAWRARSLKAAKLNNNQQS